MKTRTQLLGLGLLILGVTFNTACKNNSETKISESTNDVEVVAAPAFKNEAVTQTFQHYLQLKTALVSSNAIQAKQAAQSLANVTTNEGIKHVASSIAATEDINVQRELLSELTLQLKPILTANITAGKIYEQHCPMALKNGANWFALEQEINNPYYGDAMLHCGVVQSTLE